MQPENILRSHGSLYSFITVVIKIDIGYKYNRHHQLILYVGQMFQLVESWSVKHRDLRQGIHN